MEHIHDLLSRTATFVLAGGRGARLAPLTNKRSKPAVPFGDRRIIDFALTNCLRKDVGTIDSYYEASMTWLKNLPEDHNVSGSRSVISEGVRIHRTAEVVDSILMPGVVIGPGARVRRAILDQHVHVQAGASLGYETGERQAFACTPNGVVVVPANSTIPAASGTYAAQWRREIPLEPQVAR